MSPRPIYLVFLFVCWNINSFALSQSCQFQRVKILNNVYAKSTIRTFNGATPTAIFYPKLNEITYILNDVMYRYVQNSNDKVLNEPMPNLPNTLLVTSNIDITIKSLINKKVAVLNATSDDKIIFKKHDNLVLTIKYPTYDDKKAMYGKMYAFNDADIAIIGQFVITEWIKEVGDRVTDIAINPITGDIVVAAFDSKNDGVLYLLEKQSSDPCPEEDCLNNVDIKQAVNSALQNSQDKIVNVLKESLSNQNQASNVDIELYKDEIASLKLDALQLKMDLENLQKLNDDILDGFTNTGFEVNNPEVPLRFSRSVNNEQRVCVPKHLLIKQRERVKGALKIISAMNSVIYRLEDDLESKGNAPDIDIRNNARNYTYTTNSTKYTMLGT